MRYGWNIWFAAAMGLLAVGCQKPNALTAALDDSYKDPIQKTVEGKLLELTAKQTSTERWTGYTRDEYQPAGYEQADPVRRQMEQQRREAAEQVLRSGQLSVVVCLAGSLEFNDRVGAARAGMEAVGGDKLIARSRFLPRLAYDLSRNSVSQEVGRNVAMSFTAIQTLLEFGKDNPVDVALREVQRRALFDYEDVVAGVLLDVRLRFYTILVKEQQLQQHYQLVKEFQARYDRVRKLEQARRLLKVDLLTAELNVLNEQSRINALEREVVRQKMDLLHAIGLPVTEPAFGLEGRMEAFNLPVEQGVEMALRRGTRIAQARAAVFEQDRIVRQIVWEYLPQINAQGGYRGRYFAGGGNLVSNDQVYAAGPFAEEHIKPWGAQQFSTDAPWLSTDTRNWYWGLEMELPIFTGLERTGKFERENALLKQARHLLSDVQYATDLEVRNNYQFVMERTRETGLLEQTVRISKERLLIQERLKDLGQIDDNQLETFRERFFSDQDRYFEGQIRLIEAQERLRRSMRYFEPAEPPDIQAQKG